MQSATSFSRFGRSVQAAVRLFSTSASKTAGDEKIVAAVLFERLPVVIPKIDPVVYAFQEFSFRWRQQYRREYPEAFLKKAEASFLQLFIAVAQKLARNFYSYMKPVVLYILSQRQEKLNIWLGMKMRLGKGDYQIDFTPAPRITEADKSNDKRSLQRALDRRLYLLIYGTAYGSNGEPVWHFPEKIYESEQTLRKCAESALKSVIGDLSDTYFVGNAPMGHMVMQPSEKENDSALKRFFFKSQVIATTKFNIGKCEDYVWVTKDELLEYFPEQAQYLNKMIIS
ncbi:39S ribosomal protein L46 [Striga asiatica]|uniref:Large ribosomal subunit protein mL46 n=1 Tax=Striga asiatica TaxID=4170 RepID=A0A5A7QJB1_STRAF|nr:39S ribosomal protein L46 [Striga asiatica]